MAGVKLNTTASGKTIPLPRNTTSSKYQYYRRDNTVLGTVVLVFDMSDFSKRQDCSAWILGRRRSVARDTIQFDAILVL